MNPTEIGRREFLKLSGIAAGAALLGSPLLTACTPTAGTNASTSSEHTGYITDAISDGLPYGADKICPVICGTGDACGELHTAQCYVKDGAIVHYEGCLEGHNTGRMCAKGMSGIEVVNSPDRIKYPMRRTNEKGVPGEFERITWEEAIDEIATEMAAAIKEEGPNTVGTGWAHSTSWAHYSMTAAFNKAFGTEAMLLPDCWFDLQFGPIVTLGDMYHCLDDDPHQSKMIILWGENTSVTKPQEWADSLGAAKYEYGAKVVSIDPRVTPTAAKADIYIPLRPGTDAYVAMAMANVIIEEDLYDHDFVDKHTLGFEEFKEFVAKYTPEAVEKAAWAPADKVREVARLYATTKPAMIAIGRGGNSSGGAHSNSGWMMSRAISCLPALCGQIGMKGAGISVETSTGNATNTAYHWPKSAIMTCAAPLVTARIESASHNHGGIWGQRDVLYFRDPYGFRVYIANNNFAASSGNPAETDAAFKAINLVVIYNRTIHYTASFYADIVLPITSWPEQHMFRPDWTESVMTPPAIEPMFECKDDHEMWRTLAIALAKKLEIDAPEDEIWPWKDYEDYLSCFLTGKVAKAEYEACVDAGEKEYEGYADMTVADMEQLPAGVPNPFFCGHKDYVPYQAKHYAYNGVVPDGTNPESVWFPTDGGDGRALFKADFLAEQSGGVLPAMPLPSEPEDSYYADGNPIESGNWALSDAVKAGYDLVAVGRGHSQWQFLSFHQSPKDGGPTSLLLREAFPDAKVPCVSINPADAVKYGIAQDDLVTIESQYGKMENIKAILSQTIQPGTIFPPYHWGIQQHKIYPSSRSLQAVDQQLRPKLLPPFVGKFASGNSRRSAGGINNQSAILCKIYKA